MKTWLLDCCDSGLVGTMNCMADFEPRAHEWVNNQFYLRNFKYADVVDEAIPPMTGGETAQHVDDGEEETFGIEEFVWNKVDVDFQTAW